MVLRSKHYSWAGGKALGKALGMFVGALHMPDHMTF